MKKFMNEFKEFISRGNVMDMAVGIIIGGAFTSIVSSLVDDIINPILGLFGGMNFDRIHYDESYERICRKTETHRGRSRRKDNKRMSVLQE